MQERGAGVLVAVLGYVLRIARLDHFDRCVVQARHQPDRDALQQHPGDRGMPQTVHRRVGIEADGGDDLVDLAMAALPRMLGPRAGIALPKQWLMIGRPLAATFNLAANCTVIGTE